MKSYEVAPLAVCSLRDRRIAEHYSSSLSPPRLGRVATMEQYALGLLEGPDPDLGFEVPNLILRLSRRGL